MKKNQYVVRVIQGENDPDLYQFVEQLRYAGLVTIQTHKPLTFDIRPPHGLQSDVWADQNAQRMRSFGYNAVKTLAT